MGRLGIVTWDGYDTHEEGKNGEGENGRPTGAPGVVVERSIFTGCKHVWWAHAHDGPINCIRRNAFYPDIHLVSGGRVVSMWSLNYKVSSRRESRTKMAVSVEWRNFLYYNRTTSVAQTCFVLKGGPIWWKRFDDFANSVLWSNVHPARFQVSFATTGVLQFWNIAKFAHRPYYASDVFLGDGLVASTYLFLSYRARSTLARFWPPLSRANKHDGRRFPRGFNGRLLQLNRNDEPSDHVVYAFAALSAPRPSIHYIGADRFEYAEGINELMNDEKYELIGFSDSAGTVTMIAIDAVALTPSEIADVGRMFQKEVDRRRELDAWNVKYNELFGPGRENDNDRDSSEEPKKVQTESGQRKSTAEQAKRKTRDETFKYVWHGHVTTAALSID